MSKYGMTGCEVAGNFDNCVDGYGGSLDPKAWTTCSKLPATSTEYYQCLYNGYDNLIYCFNNFCQNDQSNQVSILKAAKDQYSGYLNTNTQTTQPAAQNPQATNAPNTPPNATGGAASPTDNNSQQTNLPPTDADTDGASSNKLSKIVIGTLLISSLIMNFL